MRDEAFEQNPGPELDPGTGCKSWRPLPVKVRSKALRQRLPYARRNGTEKVTADRLTYRQ